MTAAVYNGRQPPSNDRCSDALHIYYHVLDSDIGVIALACNFLGRVRMSSSIHAAPRPVRMWHQCAQ